MEVQSSSYKKSKEKFPSRRLKSPGTWLAIHTDYDATPPLLNETVLKKIMVYLPLKDLLNARKICKSWVGPASEEISKTALLYFDSDDEDSCSITGIKNFLFDMSSILINKAPPLFRRVQMLDMDWRSTWLVTFFKTYGHHIKELRIEMTPVSSFRSRPLTRQNRKKYDPIFEYEKEAVKKFNMEHLRNLLMFYVRNLEYLELINPSPKFQHERLFEEWHISRPDDDNNEEKQVRFILNPMGKEACNLRRIRVKADGVVTKKYNFISDIILSSLGGLEEIHLGNSIKVTPVLLSLLASGGFAKVKRLILYSLEANDILILIDASKEKNLQLDYFQCSLKSIEEIQKEDLKNFKSRMEIFLQLQRNWLKVLRFEDEAKARPLGVPLSQEMVKLTSLKMIPLDCSLNYFLSACPSLKILSLKSMDKNIDDYLWESMFLPKGSVCKSITHLELPYGLNQPDRLLKCVQYFPNVKSLVTKGVEEPTFITALWTAWPNLESLRLELVADFGENTDRIFTGFSLKMMNHMESLVTTTKQIFETRKVASIVNLSELRYLEITLGKELQDTVYSFTYITCNFGLLHLFKLKTLLFPLSQIHEQTIQKLVEQLNLDEVDFDHVPSGSRWWKC